MWLGSFVSYKKNPGQRLLSSSSQSQVCFQTQVLLESVALAGTICELYRYSRWECLLIWVLVANTELIPV